MGSQRLPHPWPGATRLWLAGILVLAFALRMWQLGQVPFGFHPDEGHNALDAWRIQNGWRPVFLPGNNGREALFFYLMAFLQGLAGPSIWSVRLTAVVAGVLGVATQFVFTRALPLPRPNRAALYAAALAAVTFWPLAQARYGLRAVLLPVWVGLLLWAWWRAIRPADAGAGAGRATAAAMETHRGRRTPAWAGFAALAGLFLAAAVYTHLTGRLLPAILLASAPFAAWRFRSGRPLTALVVTLAVGATLTLPLAAYFARTPEMLSYRSEQVSAFNPAVNEGDLPGFLVENGLYLLKAFNVEGDGSWYHNVAGRPVFDFLVGLCFLAGLALILRDLLGRRGAAPQVAALTILVALAVTLAPSWLSTGAPNYVRLTGIWPALFLLPAVGLEHVASWTDRFFAARRSSLAPRVGGILAALVIALAAALSVRDYFWRYVPHPKVYDAFNGAAVERGEAVRRLVEAGPIYVSPALWRQSVIRFANVLQPPGTFDPRFGLVLPAAGDARYAFDPVEAEDAAAFGRRWPMARPEIVRDGRGQPSLYVYRLDCASWPMPAAPFDVTFGDRLVLEGVDLPRSPVRWRESDSVPLTLAWRTLAPTAVDMNLFVHLVAPDGRTVAQWDAPPLDGSYPTAAWRAGERVLLPLAVGLPPDAPAGLLTVRLGWYDYRTGDRLAVAGDDDAAVEVGTVELVP